MVEILYVASGLKEYRIFRTLTHARVAIDQLSKIWDIETTILESDPDHWKAVE
jgi:hypothetical protein